MNNKKKLVIIFSVVLLFLLVWSAILYNNKNKYLLSINIENNNNINNPINYEEIINNVREEYQLANRFK